MKYTKPHKAIRWLRGESSQWGSDQEADILAFLDSLPAEFEIVPEDCVAVKVPIALTRAALLDAADWLDGTVTVRFCTDYAAAEFLRSIAAIAPKEKKKRKMKVLVTLDFGTHKVGPIESECEVDE